MIPLYMNKFVRGKVRLKGESHTQIGMIAGCMLQDVCKLFAAISTEIPRIDQKNWKDGLTDGGTDPHIEMRRRISKSNPKKTNAPVRITTK